MYRFNLKDFGEVNHFSFFIAREEGILMREEIEQKMIKTARALHASSTTSAFRCAGFWF